MEVKRVLWPTDFSSSAEKALPHVTSLVKQYGAEIHVLYVIEDIAHHESWYGEFDTKRIEELMKWVDKSARATAQRFYRAVVFSAPTNMVFIPPGTFRMGSPTNEEMTLPSENPQTTVTISRGFWMGKYEVTQGEYQSVMGSNPSYFSGDTNRPGAIGVSP